MGKYETISMPVISISEGTEIEVQVVEMLTEKKLTITTAESCTGGFIGATLVNVSGASAVFHEGYITYANKAKEKLLGVKKSTLKKHGAVSKQTAYQMAKGSAKRSKADVAIAVTGIAGPLGGTKEKPVGTVYVGCYVKGNTYVTRFQFDGNRSEIRQLTVVNALNMVKMLLS